MKNFNGFGAFADFLGTRPAAIHAAQNHALKVSAKQVERDAKKKIGDYQPGVGPFVPWAELADSTKADRTRKGFTPNDPLLRTGNLRASITHTVGDHDAIIGSPLDIAKYQEQGTSRIPPRPYLGPALYQNRDAVARTINDAVFMALAGMRV